MKPLIVLLIVFVFALLGQKVLGRSVDWALSARIAMSAMLMFTALGHVLFARGMAMMVPDIIPYKIQVVYATGIIELVAAVGLHLTGFRTLTGWLLILFFILILPANIKAAIEQIDYQTATLIGKGISYLWFRVPLQVLYVVWIYFCAIRV